MQNVRDYTWLFAIFQVFSGEYSQKGMFFRDYIFWGQVFESWLFLGVGDLEGRIDREEIGKGREDMG
jgi:hypothetical protein